MTADGHGIASRWLHQYTMEMRSCLATVYPIDEISCEGEKHLKVKKIKKLDLILHKESIIIQCINTHVPLMATLNIREIIKRNCLANIFAVVYLRCL